MIKQNVILIILFLFCNIFAQNVKVNEQAVNEFLKVSPSKMDLNSIYSNYHMLVTSVAGEYNIPPISGQTLDDLKKESFLEMKEKLSKVGKQKVNKMIEWYSSPLAEKMIAIREGESEARDTGVGITKSKKAKIDTMLKISNIRSVVIFFKVATAEIMSSVLLASSLDKKTEMRYQQYTDYIESEKGAKLLSGLVKKFENHESFNYSPDNEEYYAAYSVFTEDEIERTIEYYNSEAGKFEMSFMYAQFDLALEKFLDAEYKLIFSK